MEKQQECAWCGRPISGNNSRGQNPFCPDCHTTYEREAERPWHASEVRFPHSD